MTEVKDDSFHLVVLASIPQHLQPVEALVVLPGDQGLYLYLITKQRA